MFTIGSKLTWRNMCWMRSRKPPGSNCEANTLLSETPVGFTAASVACLSPLFTNYCRIPCPRLVYCNNVGFNSCPHYGFFWQPWGFSVPVVGKWSCAFTSLYFFVAWRFIERIHAKTGLVQLLLNRACRWPLFLCAYWRFFKHCTGSLPFMFRKQNI